MSIRVTMLCADLAVGGIQSMVNALGRGLSHGEFEVSFVCFDKEGAIAEHLARDGFEVRFVPRRPGFDRALPRALRRTFASLRTDIVHAHNRTALFYGVLARGLSSHPRLVYTEHDRSFPEVLKVRLLHSILARRIDAVAAVATAVANAIVATERFPRGKTEVIVNGVADPATDLSPDQARREIREEFGIPSGRRLVLAIGHLTPVKDHATLLDAIARMSPATRPFVLIAGDGELRESLEAQRASSSLQECVALPGYRADIPRLLRAADLLVMPSRSEGLSLALVEAAARGVPIVATAVGGNSEVVQDEVNGLLVPSRDPAALASAIERLCADDAMRARMGRAGLARFQSRFRLDGMIARYEDLYRRVLALA